MGNLQQLLEEKYPNSEISEIQRKAFLDGIMHLRPLVKDLTEALCYAGETGGVVNYDAMDAGFDLLHQTIKSKTHGQH